MSVLQNKTQILKKCKHRFEKILLKVCLWKLSRYTFTNHNFERKLQFASPFLLFSAIMKLHLWVLTEYTLNMSKTWKEKFVSAECTSKCRSKRDGDKLARVISRSSGESISPYFISQVWVSSHPMVLGKKYQVAIAICFQWQLKCYLVQSAGIWWHNAFVFSLASTHFENCRYCA